jgi:hypothetical protein
VSRSGKSGNLCGIQYAGPHRSNSIYGALVLLTNGRPRQGGRPQRERLRVLDEVKV